MANGSANQQKVINPEAEGLVDSLFRQLKQIFPASTQTNLKTDADEKTAKRQWIAAFSENGIRITRKEKASGACQTRRLLALYRVCIC
nr:replication protein P [Enterobacter hormaechei]